MLKNLVPESWLFIYLSTYRHTLSHKGLFNIGCWLPTKPVCCQSCLFMNVM